MQNLVINFYYFNSFCHFLFRGAVGFAGECQTLFYAEVTDDMKVSQGIVLMSFHILIPLILFTFRVPQFVLKTQLIVYIFCSVGSILIPNSTNAWDGESGIDQ